MLYTLFLLTLGIHLGQNYNEIPNVKVIFLRSVSYLKKQEKVKYFKWF